MREVHALWHVSINTENSDTQRLSQQTKARRSASFAGIARPDAALNTANRKRGRLSERHPKANCLRVGRRRPRRPGRRCTIAS